MTFDWRREPDDTIERHFNPRLTVDGAMELMAALPERAASARQILGGRLDIRYGDRPKETFDLFAARSDAMGSPPPAQIYIHGGYWRAMDKSDYSHLAIPVTAAGAAQISLNYDLCPEVTLDDIVDEIRAAIVFVYRHAGDLGIDPGRLFLAGHSAGGHLTGMMLGQDWEGQGVPADVIKGAVSVSGIFEPEAILHTSINEDVRLDLETARRADVLALPPRAKAPLLAVVGGDEPDGFHQQTAAYAERRKSASLETQVISVPGANHFTVVDAVFRAGSGEFEKMISPMV